MTARTLELAIAALLSVFAAALVFLTWREAPPAAVSAPQGDTIADRVSRLEPISPLPTQAPAEHPARAALGERLFHDTLLSRDQNVSCASCHPLARGGTDGLPVSLGVDGARGVINSPTIFNVRYNFAQFWDGRASNLHDQVAGPIHNPVEMASTWGEVISRLRAHEAYRSDFDRLYPGRGISPETIADAITQFELGLVTPDSRFDRYLRGDTRALDADEQEGYARFKEMGCASCHQGINIGGNLYQRFGVMGDYFADRGNIRPADLGRFNVTGDEADRHVFKVPSLRNVALTAPYFHDASAKTLDDAVDVMARYQLGRTLTPEDRRLIVAFLNTLTGRYRGEVLE